MNAVLQAAAYAATTTGPTLNTTGLVEWGVKNLIPPILLLIGVGMVASARKGNISENANVLSNVVLGMAVIAGAGLLYAFAGGLTGLVFGSS